jgi:hypothetical protein
MQPCLHKKSKLEAAHTLSRIFTQQETPHAFIGGFGVEHLGSVRPTDDIDTMIDVGDPGEIINRIRPLLQEQNYRFSVEGLKLYFTSGGNQNIRVTVETLAPGSLGLPPRIINLKITRTFSPKICH